MTVQNVIKEEIHRFCYGRTLLKWHVWNLPLTDEMVSPALNSVPVYPYNETWHFLVVGIGGVFLNCTHGKTLYSIHHLQIIFIIFMLRLVGKRYSSQAKIPALPRKLFLIWDETYSKVNISTHYPFLKKQPLVFKQGFSNAVSNQLTSMLDFWKTCQQAK